jgi:phosphoglycolate phosphatase
VTTSMLVDQAISSGRMDAASTERMWNIAKSYEIAGMKGADLEPGVKELLDLLKDKLRLVIVTNNAGESAEAALLENGIRSYYDLVVGREMMGRLKPQPDGFMYVAERFREELSVHDWLSVGDSWIDRQASEAAGIEFVAYRPETDKWRAAGVEPGNTIKQWSELFHYLE